MNNTSKIARAGEDDYPSQSRTVSKTLVLTEEQAYELENMSSLLKNGGLAATQSDIVRLCIESSLEEVKAKLCAVIGLGDCPSFRSK
jgi:hypothetical protein